jgi:hypothetical protein
VSSPEEYRREIAEHREDHNLPPKDPILFLEVEVCDASEFANVIKVEGMEVGGYRVLRAESSAVPNAIAAFLLHLRDRTGKVRGSASLGNTQRWRYNQAPPLDPSLERSKKD